MFQMTNKADFSLLCINSEIFLTYSWYPMIWCVCFDVGLGTVVLSCLYLLAILLKCVLKSKHYSLCCICRTIKDPLSLLNINRICKCIPISIKAPSYVIHITRPQRLLPPWSSDLVTSPSFLFIILARRHCLHKTIALFQTRQISQWRNLSLFIMQFIWVQALNLFRLQISMFVARC